MISTLRLILKSLSFSKLAIEDFPAPDSPVIWNSGIIDVFLREANNKKKRLKLN